MVSVHTSPADPLLDDPLSVRVEGLDPARTVRLRLLLHGPDGECYESVTAVDARDGTVTLRTDPGELGFLTDSVPVDDPVAEPPAFPDLLLVGETMEGERLFTETVSRRTALPGVTTERTEGEGFVADLHLPAGDGPHPGVVFLGGSGGGFPPAYRTELLASHGFAVLGTAYFGVDDLPEALSEVPVEGVESALGLLRSHEVTTDALGIVGGSRGAELGLLLAARNPSVDCVVGSVASGIVWEAAGQTSAWTVAGEPHPYLAGDFGDLGEQDEPVRFDEGHRVALTDADPETVEAASVPVEEGDAPILLLSAGDDRLWPSADLSERVVDRLDAAGFEHEYEHVCYPDAGHQIRVPFLPAHGRATGGELPDGRSMAYGGTPAGYAWADHDSWERTLSFLDRHLKKAEETGAYRRKPSSS